MATPGFDVIYYDNKFDPTTGGSLDVDVRPGVDGEAEFGTWTENINIPPAGPNGIYTVWVNQYKLNKIIPDPFTLEIFDDVNSPSEAIHSFSYPAGLDQNVSTPCYKYDKLTGAIDVGVGSCDP